MREYRNTVIMFVLIVALLFSIFLAYRSLYNAYVKSHDQESKILFYKLQNETSKLLTKLHHDYTQIKPTLIMKHKMVESYLNEHPQETNLTAIHRLINKGVKDKPYDIYITNSDLVITNTTFLPDLGFDLSFAKDIFDRHKKEKVIEPCSPLFEKSSQGFMSYSDSYLTKGDEHYVLQVSYRYDEARVLFHELKEMLKSYEYILELKAYIFLDSGFINDMIFHNYKKYKPKLDEIENRIKEGREVAKELGENSLYIKEYKEEKSPYQAIYLKTKSPILENTFIIYRLIFEFRKDCSRACELFLFHLNCKELFTYELYILDINVPKVNGLDVLKSIYDYNNHVKVIIISSNSDLKSIQKAYDYGCQDYLKKPFHIEELRLKIKLYLTENRRYLDSVKLKENEKLTKMERRFLLLLLKHEGLLVKYETIENVVYEGRAMSLESLRTMIRRLRKKLVVDRVENVIGQGYRYRS